MNITFVSDAIYPYNKGGKEKRLYELSVRLAAMGHDVHIYTMHWWSSPELERVEDGVTLHAISKLYPMYKGDIRSLRQGVFFGLACFKLLRVRFEILDVDHMPFFPIYSCWIVCKLRGRKLYGTWHEALSLQDWKDYMGSGVKAWVAFVIERVSIKLPSHIIASSQHTYDKLLASNPRLTISMISPGIDVKQLRKVKAADVDCDVLYVGRLVKDKNVDKLVSAIALLAKTNKKIRCMIVGHGIEEPKLRKQIAKLGLQKNIALLAPLKEDAEIYAHMKAAKVFCSPSVREGFGMTVLEAIGCGTPVIATNAASNFSRHLVQDGVSGSVVALSPRNLAGAITGWLDAKTPKSVLQKASDYDWNHLADRQAEVYSA